VQVGRVTVVAPPERQSLAIALAEQAERPVDWPGLGRRVPPPFLLVLAEDSATLARLTRGNAPGWGAGVALPDARTILLRADLPDLELTLRHELGHLVLRNSVRSRLPLWFDEGYAAWASGEVERFQVLELNLAVAAGRVPGLGELDRMLRGSATAADLAYALAASAVSEIARRPPPGGLGPLIARLEAGEPFPQALEAATGLAPDRFEDAWRLALRRRYSLITWLVAGGMWTLVAAGLGLLVWHRRERDRVRRLALDVGWEIPDEVVPASEETGGGGSAPVDRRDISQ
jgi:hypothetical protein